jgi:hypothetical protein
MIEVPTQLPKLSGGKGAPGSGNVCAEQEESWASIMDLEDGE